MSVLWFVVFVWCSLHVQSSPRGKYRGVHSKPGAQKTTPGLVPRRQKRLKSCRVFCDCFCVWTQSSYRLAPLLAVCLPRFALRCPFCMLLCNRGRRTFVIQSCNGIMWPPGISSWHVLTCACSVAWTLWQVVTWSPWTLTCLLVLIGLQKSCSWLPARPYACVGPQDSCGLSCCMCLSCARAETDGGKPRQLLKGYGPAQPCVAPCCGCLVNTATVLRRRLVNCWSRASAGSFGVTCGRRAGQKFSCVQLLMSFFIFSCKRCPITPTPLTCTVVEVIRRLLCMLGRPVAVTMSVFPLCNGKPRKPPQVLQAAGLNTCVGSSGLIPWRAGSSVTGWCDGFVQKRLFSWLAGWGLKREFAPWSFLKLLPVDPPCNVATFQRPVATKAVPSKRSRPPKQLRTCMLDIGPFDSVDACVAVEKCASKLGKKQNPSPKQPEEKCSFSSAYWSWVKRLLVVHGVCGPCDVYDPNHSGLLVRWCGCKGSQVNWLLVGKKWNVECGPAAVHSCLQFLKGGVARAMATRAINRELQARNLPKTFGFTCKIPRQSCLQVVRRALVQAVNSDPQWNSGEKEWLLSHVRFVSGAMKTHLKACAKPLLSAEKCAPVKLLLNLTMCWVVAMLPKTWTVWKKFGMCLCARPSRKTCLRLPLLSVSHVLVFALIPVLHKWRLIKPVIVCQVARALNLAMSSGPSCRPNMLTKLTHMTSKRKMTRSSSRMTKRRNSCGSCRLFAINGFSSNSHAFLLHGTWPPSSLRMQNLGVKRFSMSLFLTVWKNS